MELDRAACLAALGLAERDVPQLALVTSGWKSQADPTGRLAGGLELPVRRLRLVDVDGQPVLVGSAYGAAGAVEPVQLAGVLGTPAAALVGSCVSLQPGVRTGDVVVAQTATIGEGASQYYGGEATATADQDYADEAARMLVDAGATVHRGRVVSAGALLGPARRLVESWADAGHLALDLETSAVLTVAASFGMRAVCLLVVRHDQLDEQTWVDALGVAKAHRLDATAELLVDVAVAYGLARGSAGGSV